MLWRCVRIKKSLANNVCFNVSNDLVVSISYYTNNLQCASDLHMVIMDIKSYTIYIQ